MLQQGEGLGVGVNMTANSVLFYMYRPRMLFVHVLSVSCAAQSAKWPLCSVVLEL